MTEATPFQRKYDITFLCPPTIAAGDVFYDDRDNISVERKGEGFFAPSIFITAITSWFQYNTMLFHRVPGHFFIAITL